MSERFSSDDNLSVLVTRGLARLEDRCFRADVRDDEADCDGTIEEIATALTESWPIQDCIELLGIGCVAPEHEARREEIVIALEILAARMFRAGRLSATG
jgi:hypothetical protein